MKVRRNEVKSAMRDRTYIAAHRFTLGVEGRYIDSVFIGLSFSCMESVLRTHKVKIK